MIKKVLKQKYKSDFNLKKRRQLGMFAGAFGILTNTLLFILKLIFGLLSNSITIITDSFNNLSDSLSSAVTIIGFKLASKPADKEHPYGHARYEYLAGVTVSMLIFAMGIVSAKTSIEKILNPNMLNISYTTIAILIIAIILKLFQMIIYLDFAKFLNSNTIKATSDDSRNDAITTSAILIATIIMKRFNLNIDPYLGLLVSVYIIITSIGSLNDTINPLIGSTPNPEQIKSLGEIISSFEVNGFHDLMLHNYGIGNDFANVHIEVPANSTLLEAHDLADRIERKVKEKLNIDLTIHIDPLEFEDERTINLKENILQILKTFDNTLEIHDFRVVPTKSNIKIIFDVLAPHDKDYTEKDIVKLLKDNIHPEGLKYYYIINIDHPFC